VLALPLVETGPSYGLLDLPLVLFKYLFHVYPGRHQWSRVLDSVLPSPICLNIYIEENLFAYQCNKNQTKLHQGSFPFEVSYNIYSQKKYLTRQNKLWSQLRK
jgi:hypothetical protein